MNLSYAWGGLLEELSKMQGFGELLEQREDLQSYICKLKTLEESKTLSELKELVSTISVLDRNYLNSKLLDSLYFGTKEENCLLYPSKIGCVDALQFLLDKGAVINNDALIRAIKNGKIEVVKYLIQKGLKLFNAKSYIDESFYIASEYDKPDILDFLLNELEKQPTSIIENKIECAKMPGAFYTVEEVLKKAKEKTYFEELKTELILLIFKIAGYDSLNCVKYLLHNYRRYLTSDCVQSCFNHACDAGNKDVCEYLLTCTPFHINFDMALFNACSHGGTIQFCNFLKEAGAKFDRIKSNETTFISFTRWVCQRGSVEIFKYALENGVNLFSKSSFVLMLSTAHNNYDLVKFLLESGIHPHETFGDGQDFNKCVYPIVYACEYGTLELIKLLISYGAKLTVEPPEEMDLVRGACKGGRYDILLFLLEQGLPIKDFELVNKTTNLERGRDYNSINRLLLKRRPN